jgi:hypothetical protein
VKVVRRAYWGASEEEKPWWQGELRDD